VLSTYAGMNKKLIRVFEQHYNDNCVDFYHRISIISPFYTVVRDYAILSVGFFRFVWAQRQTGGEALNFVFPSTKQHTRPAAPSSSETLCCHVFQQETQLMQTNRATRLEVSQGHQT